MQFHHVYILHTHPRHVQALLGRHTAHGVATEAKEAVIEGVGQVGAHVLGHNLNCMVLYTQAGRPRVDRLGDEEEGKREMVVRNLEREKLTG